MIALVKEYNTYIDSIPELIEKSDYKLEYYIKNLNISKPTMYRKLREKAFTINEITKLTKLLFPKEAYKEELLASIEEGREDFRKGNVISSAEIRKEMRKKIESYQ